MTLITWEIKLFRMPLFEPLHFQTGTRVVVAFGLTSSKLYHLGPILFERNASFVIFGLIETSVFAVKFLLKVTNES